MRLLIWLLVVTACAGCASSTSQTVESTMELAPIGELSPPSLRGDLSLEEALASRRSVREYGESPLSVPELSQLLWAAQGLTAASGGRTVPSAGGLYPLEIYVVTAQGAHHYVPDGHYLEVLTGADLRTELMSAGLEQSAIGDAPAVFVIAGVVSRTEAKYGDRAERYVILEAGHAAQNLLLEAVALGLGAVPIGAFRDDEVAETLALPDGGQPLYLIPVGRPASQDE
jgi:SagB-type dehydrogenase family enzyme